MRPRKANLRPENLRMAIFKLNHRLERASLRHLYSDKFCLRKKVIKTLWLRQICHHP